MHIVYVLELTGRKRLYIGVTGDLEERIQTHKRGHVKSTRNLFKGVIYTEVFNSKKEAWAREKWLKSGVGRNWLKQKLDIK